MHYGFPKVHPVHTDPLVPVFQVSVLTELSDFGPFGAVCAVQPQSCLLFPPVAAWSVCLFQPLAVTRSSSELPSRCSTIISHGSALKNVVDV